MHLNSNKNNRKPFGQSSYRIYIWFWQHTLNCFSYGFWNRYFLVLCQWKTYILACIWTPAAHYTILTERSVPNCFCGLMRLNIRRTQLLNRNSILKKKALFHPLLIAEGLRISHMELKTEVVYSQTLRHFYDNIFDLNCEIVMVSASKYIVWK